MKKVLAIPFLVIGGTLLLIAVGMALVSAFDVESTELYSWNVKEKMQWGRLAFYALVIALWKPICTHLIVRDKVKEEGSARGRKITQFRWKLVVLFLFFEVAMVHQFPFGG